VENRRQLPGGAARSSLQLHASMHDRSTRWHREAAGSRPSVSARHHRRSRRPANTPNPAISRPLSRFLRPASRPTDTGFYLRTAPIPTRSTGFR
jgi:hypothetical protein